MSNKIKKLICSLLASAMLVTSAGVVAWAAPEDEAATNETAVTETAGDSSTADQTDEEKEVADTEATETTADATEAPSAEATATPEATVEPEATEAPVVVATGSDYEYDDYYKKSLALCSSLGIISGFEDGSVKPDEKVTRAQMASIVLRMLALDGTSPYQNIFTDVDASHWAANQIQSAYEASIVSGMGDGTFAPDAEVTYAQVMVMLVNAMNYKDDADYYGGWQQGYIKEAGEIGLLKNCTGSADVASDRGVVIKMVYNALLADYKEIRTFDEYGQPKYSTDKTLAEVKFDVIEAKGMVIGTNKTTIGSTDVNEGQIEIQKKENKETTDEVYDTVLTGLEDYIGLSVTYYYKEISGKTDQLLAITYDSSKSEVYEINDVDDIDTVKEAGGEVTIKVKKISKERTAAADAKYIYNGKLVSKSDLGGTTIKDLIENMEQGTIKMVKSDKSLNDYDIVFIDSYTTLVVTSANDSKLIGKIQDPRTKEISVISATYELDDTVDRTITVTKAGSEVRVRNLKKNDVASVRANYSIKSSTEKGITFSPEVLDVVVTGESVTGTSSSVSSKEFNNTYASINGDRYDVANVAVNDLKTGSQSVFYLDKFGKIGYIESSTAGRLEAGEEYGWLVNVYKQEGSSDQVVKLVTKDGIKEYTLASNVDYWGPNALVGDADAGVTKPKSEVETAIKDIIANKSFVRLYKTETVNTTVFLEYGTGNPTKSTNSTIRNNAEKEGKPYTDTGIRPTDYIKTDKEVRLVKYKVNGSDKITELYFAVSSANVAASRYYEGQDDYNTAWLGPNNIAVADKYLTDSDITKLKDSDALLFDPSNKNGSVLVGGLLGGYTLTDDCLEFDVPDNPDKYTNETSYTVANVVSSKYNVRENGVGDDFYFADYDGTTPAALIRVVSDPDAAVDVKLGTADNIPMMVVDKVNIAYDKNEDKQVYKVVGYTAGAETSFTTTETTALYDSMTAANKDYSGTKTWDGKDGGVDGESDSLAHYLKKGDLIVQSGGRILRFAKASDIVQNNGVSAGNLGFGSDTRVKYFWGPVTESEVDNVSWFKVNGQTFSVDDGAAFDVIEIDLTAGTVNISDDLADVADLRVLGTDPDETDYAFVRIAPKGALGEVVIYRVTK